MKSNKMLLIGMGSFKDEQAFEDARINGKTINEFLFENEIYVYRDPMKFKQTDATHKFLVTSFHRTAKDATGYADDLAKLSKEGYKIAALLYGGLAFSLAGDFASEAYNIPIIGVPATGHEFAFQSMFYLPNGTPVGIVEEGRISKGLIMVDRMLSLGENAKVTLVSTAKPEFTEEVSSLLTRLVGEHDMTSNTSALYNGITMFLADNTFEMEEFDKKVEFGIFGTDEGLGHKIYSATMPKLSNSIVVGRLLNPAVYAARVKGMTSREVNDNLRKYYEELKNLTDRRITAIQYDDFKLPKMP